MNVAGLLRRRPGLYTLVYMVLYTRCYMHSYTWCCIHSYTWCYIHLYTWCYIHSYTWCYIHSYTWCYIHSIHGAIYTRIHGAIYTVLYTQCYTWCYIHSVIHGAIYTVLCTPSLSLEPEVSQSASVVKVEEDGVSLVTCLFQTVTFGGIKMLPRYYKYKKLRLYWSSGYLATLTALRKAGRAWTGFIWLRTGAGDGLLWTR